MKWAFLGRSREAAGGPPRKGAAPIRWSQRLGRWLALGALIIIIVLLVTPFFYLDKIRLHEGEIVPQTIVSQIPFTYDDPESLEAWRKKRDAEYQRVYRYDSRIQDQAIKNLNALFARLNRYNLAPEDFNSTPALTQLADQLENISTPDGPIGFILSDSTLKTIWRRRNDSKYIHDLRGILRHFYLRCIVDNATQFRSHGSRLQLEPTADPPPEPIIPSQVLDYPEGVYEYLTLYLRGFFEGAPERPDDSPRAAAREVLANLISPNIAFDDEASRRQREHYREGFQGVRRTVNAGGVLFVTGRTITERDKEIIDSYNTSLRRYVTLRLVGNVGFVMLVLAIIGFYVIKIRRDFSFDVQTTLITALPLVIVLAIEKLLLFLLESRVSPDLSGYAFPAATIGMLGVLLVDVRLAIILVTWGCLLFGLEVDMNFRYVAVALLGGYTAVAALFTIRERREVLLAGLRIAFVNALGIITINFIDNPTAISLRPAAVGIINGLVCSFLTIALLPVFEMIFGIVTDVRLLELTGLPHPLTDRLEQETPGTWQHSMNVAKLAEAAARAIGVNYLLVRAGAYFHDIGKTRKPAYFTENQATPEDKRRHQELRPQMSVLIIRDHVKFGVEMARQTKLPEKIIDFIPQHHGTSLIRYFYAKALKQYEAGETKAPVHEEDYRYPGPKPRSRETAIVMLADAVEATATAKLTSAHVREDDIQILVRDAILDKFNDGQFSECDLTMRDLEQIRESFVAQLHSRFHTRIDYPKLNDK